MNILLESRAFYPSVGGIEMMSHELAVQWKKMGHQVTIVSQTPLGRNQEIEEIEIIRNPSVANWCKLMQWSEVFVQNGISLRSAGWPLLTNTPFVIVHQTILDNDPGLNGGLSWLKKQLTKSAQNITISKPVKEPIRGPAVLIPNAFRSLFNNYTKEKSESEFNQNKLMFVGRLVSVKGVDVALKAFKKMADAGFKGKLIIYGDGPEKENLQKLRDNLDLTDRVVFEGWIEPEKLAKVTKNISIQLIPSRYEPFGIVALEAIACNCVPVAANTGGLPEAVGPCGILVEPDNPDALAEGILQAIEQRYQLLKNRAEHLEKFQIDKIAGKYLEVFEKVVNE